MKGSEPLHMCFGCYSTAVASLVSRGTRASGPNLGEGTPGYQPQQRNLQWQTRDQRPVRHIEQSRLLKHVNVHGRDRNRERKKPDTSCASSFRIQHSGRTHQLESTAHQNCSVRPGNIGWYQAHFCVVFHKMKYASDEEPDEHKRSADTFAGLRSRGLRRGVIFHRETVLEVQPLRPSWHASDRRRCSPRYSGPIGEPAAVCHDLPIRGL